MSEFFLSIMFFDSHGMESQRAPKLLKTLGYDSYPPFKNYSSLPLVEHHGTSWIDSIKILHAKSTINVNNMKNDL